MRVCVLALSACQNASPVKTEAGPCGSPTTAPPASVNTAAGAACQPAAADTARPACPSGPSHPVSPLGSVEPALARRCPSPLSARSVASLCNPMDCSPPGSPVEVVLQARILGWVRPSNHPVIATLTPSFDGETEAREDLGVSSARHLAHGGAGR